VYCPSKFFREADVNKGGTLVRRGVTTYRSWRWWAMVWIVTVLHPVSIIGVVWTMVGASIICIWLMPVQLGHVVVIAC